MRYCHELRRWYLWDGKRWAPDRIGAVLALAADTVAAQYAEAESLAGGDERPRSRLELMQHPARLRAMLSVARARAPIPVLPDELDADPWLLNLANGTLDLRENCLRLRDHRKSDLITRLLPVAYKPEARCPAWHSFLDRVVPDPAVRAFLQRAAGYSLTGDSGARCLFVLVGPGANGKGLFLEALRRVAGEYAATTPAATLLSGSLAPRSHGGLPAELFRLRGSRLVLVGQTAGVARLSEDALKVLTGGSAVALRLPGGGRLDDQPQGKLWMAVDQHPELRGTDSVWQRLCVVPFEVSIPPATALPRWQLLAQFKEQAEGILSWLVEGAGAYRHEGLAPPPAVTSALDTYRAEMDDVRTFVEQHLDTVGDPTEEIADRSGFHRLDALRYVVSSLNTRWPRPPIRPGIW